MAGIARVDGRAVLQRRDGCVGGGASRSAPAASAFAPTTLLGGVVRFPAAVPVKYSRTKDTAMPNLVAAEKQIEPSTRMQTLRHRGNKDRSTAKV